MDVDGKDSGATEGVLFFSNSLFHCFLGAIFVSITGAIGIVAELLLVIFVRSPSTNHIMLFSNSNTHFISTQHRRFCGALVIHYLNIIFGKFYMTDDVRNFRVLREGLVELVELP